MRQSWFAPFVVTFWCVTMGWLVVTKIVPPLLPGSPPGYKAFYLQSDEAIPVAWKVFWNDSQMGWAVTRSQATFSGGLLVTNRLQFDRIPLDEMLPPWMRLMARQAFDALTDIRLNMIGHLLINNAGELQSFDSTVSIPGTSDTIHLSGTIDDGHVRLLVQSGQNTYETHRYLPDGVLISDELSPQATLPGLLEGQQWTVPIYSPLRPGHAPIEILHAKVEGRDTITWNKERIFVSLVTYRDDPASRRAPRCRLWVDTAGRVLKQESQLLGSRLTFLRLPDDEALRIATEFLENIPDTEAAHWKEISAP